MGDQPRTIDVANVARAVQLTNAGAALQREAENLTNDLTRASAKWYQAIDQYRAAVELDPTAAMAYWGQGLTLCWAI